jgi:hypothetical protein
MSFEPMKEGLFEQYHSRQAIIAYYFLDNEKKLIQTVAKLAKISDVIFVEPNQGNQTLRSLLDGEIKQDCTSVIREKTLIFNGISSDQINLYMNLLKKYRLKRPLMAYVTEQSIEWPLQFLLEHLVAERQSFNTGGKGISH